MTPVYLNADVGLLSISDEQPSMNEGVWCHVEEGQWVKVFASPSDSLVVGSSPSFWEVFSAQRLDVKSGTKILLPGHHKSKLSVHCKLRKIVIFNFVGS